MISIDVRLKTRWMRKGKRTKMWRNQKHIFLKLENNSCQWHLIIKTAMKWMQPQST